MSSFRRGDEEGAWEEFQGEDLTSEETARLLERIRTSFTLPDDEERAVAHFDRLAGELLPTPERAGVDRPAHWRRWPELLFPRTRRAVLLAAALALLLAGLAFAIGHSDSGPPPSGSSEVPASIELSPAEDEPDDDHPDAQAEVTERQADCAEDLAGIERQRAAVMAEREEAVAEAQADLEEELAELDREQAEATRELKAEVAGIKADYGADLRELEREWNEADPEDRPEIEREIDAVERERDAAIREAEKEGAATLDDLDDERADIRADYEEAIADANADLEEALAELDAELQAVTAECEAAT